VTPEVYLNTGIAYGHDDAEAIRAYAPLLRAIWCAFDHHHGGGNGPEPTVIAQTSNRNGARFKVMGRASFSVACAASLQRDYCLDRSTVPKLKLGPEHESRAAAAVSRLEVTTTLTSSRPRSVDPPDPDPPAQEGGGSTYNVIPYLLVPTKIPRAGPAKLSPLLNVADQVPVSEPRGFSLSDKRAVPAPEVGSLIVPDQVPAGDATGVGDAGVSLPPQPARQTMIVTTTASRGGIPIIQ
jgi:hypothetical protein